MCTKTDNFMMNDSFVIQDCTNHGCASAFSAGDWEANPITAIEPAGYVPETITNTQQGYIDFAGKIIDQVQDRAQRIA